MINQGMIQGNSRFVYRLKRELNNQEHPIYFSKTIVENHSKRELEPLEKFKETLRTTSLYTASGRNIKIAP